jgi:uncharacterized membrane-anchored protein YjiN (DUF445 family)
LNKIAIPLSLIVRKTGVYRKNPDQKADTFIKASENNFLSQREVPTTKRPAMKNRQNGKQPILQLNTEFNIRLLKAKNLD